MARVIALQAGHDGRHFREAGEQFDIDLEDPRFKGSTWFEEVAKAKARPAKVVDPNAQPPGAGPKKGSAPAEDPIA